MKKEQRTMGGKERDRFLVNVTAEMGEQIRAIAHRKGVSLSKLIGELIEAHLLDELEGDNQ